MPAILSSLPMQPHDPRKGWRFQKGKTERGTNLQVWLKPPRDSAQVAYAALNATWARMQYEGRSIWTQAEIDAALSFVRPAPIISQPTPQVELKTAPVFKPNAERADRPEATKLTLHAALDKWLESYKGEPSYWHKKERLDSIKLHIADRPMAMVDKLALEEMRRKVLARPKSRRDGEPISIVTCQTWLQSLGQAFRWLDKFDLWIAPRGFHYLATEFFTIDSQKQRQLATKVELKNLNKPKPTFTLDELKTLYRLATPGQRFYLLMGLMLGWTQKEMATLERDEFVTRGDQYFIERDRNKTGCEGCWWVCPELASMLIERMKQKGKDNLALHTSEGMPLVHLSANGQKSDSVREVWNGVRRRAVKQGVQDLPFGRLRKCGGQMIENLSGSHELAQIFMAQRRVTVASKHYTSAGRDVGVGKTTYERLHEYQKQMYAALKPMFDAAFAKSEPTQIVTAQAA